MCKWGTDQEVQLCKPRANGMRYAKVDACIAPLVQALNDAGIETVASCCGHGNRPGNIALAGGRELFILPDYEAARELDKEFPFNIQGETKENLNGQ